LYTTVNYTEHVAVMSSVKNFGIIETQKIFIIHTVFIIVPHLNGGAFIRKLKVKFSYCVLTALVYQKFLFVNVVIDIEIS